MYTSKTSLALLVERFGPGTHGELMAKCRAEEPELWKLLAVGDGGYRSAIPRPPELKQWRILQPRPGQSEQDALREAYGPGAEDLTIYALEAWAKGQRIRVGAPQEAGPPVDPGPGSAMPRHVDVGDRSDRRARYSIHRRRFHGGSGESNGRGPDWRSEG
jgi:hypothetical protein